MSKILGIESATSSGSVALAVDGKIIGQQYYHLEKSHSSLLHPMIDQLMKNVGMELAELDAIALSKGPGSYTGLRIGASTAKGLCYALDLPLIAINTLKVLANQMNRFNTAVDYYIPMLDARRMEVYTMVLDNELNVVSETQPLILDESSFADWISDGRTMFFGDGSDKFQSLLTNSHAIFVDEIFPKAADVALMAEQAFEETNFENVISFEPFYLKEFRTTTPKK